MDPAVANGVALITGAGSGMGREIALLLAGRGCTKFLLADIVQGALEETKSCVLEISSDAQVVTQATDVSKDAAVKSMVETCVSAFGRLNIAINCAGIARGSVRTVDTTAEEFKQLCNVNEKGVFLCEKHEIIQFLKQEPVIIPNQASERAVRGVIVNIASIAATAAIGELAAYTSSKHAVLGLSKVDARVHAPDKIRINCVSPGFVNTPMMGKAGLSAECLASMEAQSPMNRMTLAREVAEAAVFLSSSSASGITGSNLIVDAGANLFHLV